MGAIGGSSALRSRLMAKLSHSSDSTAFSNSSCTSCRSSSITRRAFICATTCSSIIVPKVYRRIKTLFQPRLDRVSEYSRTSLALYLKTYIIFKIKGQKLQLNIRLSSDNIISPSQLRHLRVSLITPSSPRKLYLSCKVCGGG